MADKTYYYLKLHKDFFDKHYVKAIKRADRGYEMLYFLLFLYTESVNHSALLRFNENVPYDNELLSMVSGIELDIIDYAMKYFQKLGILEVMKDGTIYLPECDRMIGSESESAERVRRHRAKKSAETDIENFPKTQKCNAFVTECNADVTKCNDIQELEKDIDIDVAVALSSISNKNVTNKYININNIEPQPLPEIDNLSEIVSLWNEQKCTHNIQSIKPLSRRYDNTKLCIANDYEGFKNTIRSLDAMAWFKNRDKPITYDWFVDTNNYTKVVEGNYQTDFNAPKEYEPEIYTGNRDIELTDLGNGTFVDELGRIWEKP